MNKVKRVSKTEGKGANEEKILIASAPRQRGSSPCQWATEGNRGQQINLGMKRRGTTHTNTCRPLLSALQQPHNRKGYRLTSNI